MTNQRFGFLMHRCSFVTPHIGFSCIFNCFNEQGRLGGVRRDLQRPDPLQVELMEVNGCLAQRHIGLHRLLVRLLRLHSDRVPLYDFPLPLKLVVQRVLHLVVRLQLGHHVCDSVCIAVQRGHRGDVQRRAAVQHHPRGTPRQAAPPLEELVGEHVEAVQVTALDLIHSE